MAISGGMAPITPMTLGDVPVLSSAMSDLQITVCNNIVESYKLSLRSGPGTRPRHQIDVGWLSINMIDMQKFKVVTYEKIRK